MTGDQIKDFVEELIEDDLADAVFLALVNNAKNKLEAEGGRDWELLKVSAEGTADANAKTLPDNYLRTLAMYVREQPYYQIPFEQKKLFENSAYRWYLDLRNNNFYLIGPNITGTLTHVYLKGTDDIELGEEVPIWPARFHRMFGFEAAQLFFAIDQEDRSRTWDDKWEIQYQLMKNALIDWDTALNRRANENALPPDVMPDLDIGLLGH